MLGEGCPLRVRIECSAGLSRGEQVACALELFVEFEFEPGSFDFSAGLGDGEVERLSPGAERTQKFALGGALPPAGPDTCREIRVAVGEREYLLPEQMRVGTRRLAGHFGPASASRRSRRFW